MASATELPQELCYDPMSFVVLTGLDIKYNAVHKSVWDAFSNNRRTDRVPISFGCLPGDHSYPRAKDKRTSYEWYIPKGILKTKWMDKHLHRVPAVVVVFFELDWDEPVWREKQMECASRVEVVRASLQGRGTKVAVVLIQKSAPLPPGEDMVAAERAAALCSACELSAKSLFVLPHTDHLLGYIIRLENAFYELANSYYHTEARRVKAHKEFLNKTTHQLLFVRHQFKIAFFNELMQDPANSLKHYRQAYNHIHELRSYDTNNLELKVMGGFISYKICRICFLRLNNPLEAIAQFRRHVDMFKPKSGNQMLTFEHSAWMCKQFTVFGDLFDEAIKGGLAAIQTQHPGFYYQQAAFYAQDRRAQAKRLCIAGSDQEYPNDDPLDTGGQPLDFYGQRPWRQGHQSIDPPAVNKEKDGILALKHQEATIDHSSLIIPLLSSAVTQFKKYKCPRMKRFLLIQMGEEYYHAQDYGKAATLLSHTAWDYRSSKWWDVLHRILVLTLRCSYLVADVQQYTSACIELLGRNSKASQKERTRIQKNFLRVVSGKVPDPEPLSSLDNSQSETDHVEALEAAKQLWAKVVSEPQVCNIDLNSLAPFIECQTSFGTEECCANEAVSLHIYFRTCCPFPIRFSELFILLGNPEYDKYCSIADSDGMEFYEDLYFEPNKFKHLAFSFPPDSSDVRNSIRVTSVRLKIGCENNSTFLTWNMADHNHAKEPVLSVVSTKRLLQKDAPANVRKWSDIIPIVSCTILNRPPLVKVDVRHMAPALINEIYRIRIEMESDEKEDTENTRAIIRLEAGQPEEIFNTTFLALDVESVLAYPTTKVLEVDFEKLSRGEKRVKDIFVHVTKGGLRNLSARITYDINDQVEVQKIESAHPTKCACFIEESISFDAVPAFQLSPSLVSKDFGAFKDIQPGEAFMAVVDISCSSPWPVVLDSGNVVLKGAVISLLDGPVPSCVNGIILENGESASDLVRLKCKEDVIFEEMHDIPTGQYSLKWKRCEEGSLGFGPMPLVSTSLELPDVTVRTYPLKLHLDLPPHGTVLERFCATYTLSNCSSEPRELEVMCEVPENITFSGVRLQRARVFPGADLSLTYAMYPLATGFQALPSFRVNEIPPDGYNATKQPTEDDLLSCSYLKESIPTSIFIKPNAKNE